MARGGRAARRWQGAAAQHKARHGLASIDRKASRHANLDLITDVAVEETVVVKVVDIDKLRDVDAVDVALVAVSVAVVEAEVVPVDVAEVTSHPQKFPLS